MVQFSPGLSETLDPPKVSGSRDPGSDITRTSHRITPVTYTRGRSRERMVD